MAEGNSRERLQKLLSRSGIASRRAAEDLIREGRVTVNGRVATVGTQVDPAQDAVKVDGRRVQPSTQRRYILINKPVGVISTVHDPEGRDTVLEILPQPLRRGLVPVGRLDFDSEGLLLLTDDGELALHVAHPRYGCRKTYEVKVKGRPSSATVDKLRQGITLYGKTTAPARVEGFAPKASGGRESTANSWWRVVLGEGRTRQIREMFFRAGHPVQRLRRVAIGTLRDDHLPPGGWRELTTDEVETLREATKKVQKREKSRPRPSESRGGGGPRSRGAGGGGSTGRGSEGRPSSRGGPKRGAGGPWSGSSKDGSSRSGPGRRGGTSSGGTSSGGSSRGGSSRGPSRGGSGRRGPGSGGGKGRSGPGGGGGRRG